MYEERVYPFAFGSFKAPEVSWDDDTGEGSPYFTYVYSCQAAEVLVNADTGTVRVTRVVAAHDSGRVVNPQLFEGQIYGGIVMGLGMALKENLRVEQGRILSLNYNSYKVPNAGDAPDITILPAAHSDPLSPFGCKGIGEPAMELIAPAIASALSRATGKRYNTLPLQPASAVGPWNTGGENLK
jgi:CO/xanthine dehydrogenase Mo-binding subunit